MSVRERVDAFPTQLVATVVWLIVGVGATAFLAKNPYERMLLGISFYAIVISHWTAHLAWRAKRAAGEATTDSPPPPPAA